MHDINVVFFFFFFFLFTDTDTFVHSKTFQKLIRCSDSRFLIVNEDEQFDLEDLTIEQLSSPSKTLDNYFFSQLIHMHSRWKGGLSRL